MVPRPSEKSTDEEILGFVFDWIDYLVESGYESAIALLDDPLDKERHKWTKTEWDLELSCYGEAAVVTSARGISHLRSSIIRYSDGSGFSVYCELPIDWQPSDHTLQFVFRTTESRMHIELDDLHVL